MARVGTDQPCLPHGTLQARLCGAAAAGLAPELPPCSSCSHVLVISSLQE